MLLHQNYAAGGGNSSIMVGMFVSLCLASQKPSEWEFFVPAGTDLGVQLLLLTFRQNGSFGCVLSAQKVCIILPIDRVSSFLF